jgi:hypothetical protein
VSDLLERMRASPASDWQIADIERLCREHKIRCAPPRGGGSHYKISHAGRPEILTVPYRKPVKTVYIRKLVQFIDAIGASDDHA